MRGVGRGTEFMPSPFPGWWNWCCSPITEALFTLWELQQHNYGAAAVPLSPHSVNPHCSNRRDSSTAVVTPPPWMTEARLMLGRMLPLTLPSLPQGFRSAQLWCSGIWIWHTHERHSYVTLSFMCRPGLILSKSVLLWHGPLTTSPSPTKSGTLKSFPNSKLLEDFFSVMLKGFHV